MDSLIAIHANAKLVVEVPHAVYYHEKHAIPLKG
jgi:hypothetical protein